MKTFRDVVSWIVFIPPIGFASKVRYGSGGGKAELVTAYDF